MCVCALTHVLDKPCTHHKMNHIHKKILLSTSGHSAQSEKVCVCAYVCAVKSDATRWNKSLAERIFIKWRGEGNLSEGRPDGWRQRGNSDAFHWLAAARLAWMDCNPWQLGRSAVAGTEGNVIVVLSWCSLAADETQCFMAVELIESIFLSHFFRVKFNKLKKIKFLNFAKKKKKNRRKTGLYFLL